MGRHASHAKCTGRVQHCMWGTACIGIGNLWLPLTSVLALFLWSLSSSNWTGFFYVILRTKPEVDGVLSFLVNPQVFNSYIVIMV